MKSIAPCDHPPAAAIFRKQGARNRYTSLRITNPVRLTGRGRLAIAKRPAEEQARTGRDGLSETL